MPAPLLYLKAMGAAAIVSAMFVLAMAGVRRSPNRTRLNSACVLGMGFGLTLGGCVMSLQLAWPPKNGLDRLFTIIIPAVFAIEMIAGFQRVPRWLVWLLRMSLAAMIPRILLHGSIYLNGSGGEWTFWQVSTVFVVSSSLLAAVWVLLFVLSKRPAGVSIPLVLCMTLQSVGVTVMLAGYIKGGAAAFPIVATLAATTIGAWLIQKRCGGNLAAFVPPALIGIGVVGLFSLLFIGRYFGRLSTGTSLTLLLAPLLCWATETWLLRDAKPWLVGTIRLLLVAIPLVVVLFAAKRDFDRDMAPLLGIAQPSSFLLHRSEIAAGRKPSRFATPDGSRRTAKTEIDFGTIPEPLAHGKP